MRRTALLAVAVVLAGCGGLGAVDDTETRTLTPVAVPEEERDGEATQTATPAVSVADAIEDDPLSVVAFHERRLRESGFSVRVRHALDDGATYRLNATVAGGRYRGGVRRTAPDGNGLWAQAYYNDRQALYVRIADRGEDGSTAVSYRSLPPSFSLPFDATRADQLRVLFGAADLDLVRVVDSRRRSGVYLVSDGATVVDELPAYPAPVRNATVRDLAVTVTSPGVVTAYSFEYRGTRDGDRIAGRVRVETATVDRRAPAVPDWYDRALANTSRVAVVGTPQRSLAARNLGT